MPWNNQSGGGGGPWGGGGSGGGGNQGGPWGQGPKGPNGPQNQPPDLEDIFRRGQDRLKNALPGGATPGPAVFIFAALALIAVWMFKAIYSVQPSEQAVELVLGKPKSEALGQGLHFHWWPVETVEKVVTAQKLISIGSRGGAGATGSGLMLSGDQNIVDVQFTIAYQINNPQAYLFDVADPDAMVRQVGESAMREIVGRRPVQDVFRDKRQEVADEVKTIVQSTLDDYKAGVSIIAINIEDAAPPQQVADAFNDVQRAEQDEDRFTQQGNQFSNQRLGQARGQAAQISQEAEAYKNRIVEEAKGEAQRFVSVYDEYAKAPDVTRKRLFLETMEKVYKDSNKIIMDENGQGVVPYLPLNELQRRQPATGVNP